MKLTRKEIVSLSIRLFLLNMIHSDRTEVLLIVFVTSAREKFEELHQILVWSAFEVELLSVEQVILLPDSS